MATYLDNPKLVFIHIPKNGGTSVTRWLRHHLDARKGDFMHGGMQHIEPEYYNAKTFAITRNPWDRMVSLYHFDGVKCKAKIDKGKGKGDYINQYAIYKKGFEYWLKHGLDYTSNWMQYKTTQSAFLPGNPTYLLRFENLKEDWKIIQEVTKCYKPLQKKNSTVHNHYRTYYNDELKNLVGDIFRADVIRFNYDF